MVCGRRLERPNTPLFPTHNVWMARAAARLGYRWRWVHAQQGVGVCAPCGSMPAYTYCTESAESQGQSACGGGGHALCMLRAGSDLFLWGVKWWSASLSLTCVYKGPRVEPTLNSPIANVPATRHLVPVDCSQVPCSRFVFRPYSLGWEEGEEKKKIFQISSMLPRGGSAHAAQLSCGLRTPAAAQSTLSPAWLSCSLHHGLALPRLPGSHARVPVFPRLVLSLCGRTGAVWFSQEGASFPFPPHAHACTQNGTELTFSSSLHTFVFQCSSSECRPTETRRCYQESTSVHQITLQQHPPPL